MKRITLKWLEEAGACEEHRLLFKELYPKGIAVCWKCFREAQWKGLDVEWLSCFVSHDVFCELNGICATSSRRFPKLEKRFGTFGEWIVLIYGAVYLKRLEKAYLENDFDISQF